VAVLPESALAKMLSVSIYYFSSTPTFAVQTLYRTVTSSLLPVYELGSQSEFRRVCNKTCIIARVSFTVSVCLSV
jgi:hypothetical protein